MHVVQVGTGRVGRPTAYTILCSKLANKLTLCNTKPGLAYAFAEELKHVTSCTAHNVKIESCERDEDILDADIILISAGKPRIPGVKMTRRDLALQNGQIIKEIAKIIPENNPRAKYIVITNPVDAIAMVFKKYSKADFVLSTGASLETLRFRAGLSNSLGIPISLIQGWVGGEHGINAIPLWSTVRINDQLLEDYLKLTRKKLCKEEIESYVKSISKVIIDNIGGTEYGPAGAFRDILRAIINDTNEILPVSFPTKFKDLPESIFVSIPRKIGLSIGESIYNDLSEEEKINTKKAAEAIYNTYKLSP